MTRPAWVTEALCARPDMARFRELFFPLPGERTKAEAAKQICAACPVREDCLADILKAEGGRSTEGRHGIVGGKAPKQRYTLYVSARNRRRAAA